MNSELPAILVSLATPALALVLLFHTIARWCRRQPRGWSWFLGLSAIALTLVVLPVQGLPLARWLAGFVDHWSVPTLALLVTSVVQNFFNVELLRHEDRRAAWAFGALAGVALYPMALGLGPYDPFSHGWHFGPFFAVVGIVAVLLQWRRNRFGVVLLLAASAWALRVPESGNYWDCLLDPFYFLASLAALTSAACRARKLPAGPSSPQS